MARNQQRAFTKVELLAVLAIGALLAVVLFAVLEKNKRKSQQISCVGKLKNVSLGFLVFAAAPGDKFPMQTSTSDGGVKEWMGAGTNVYRIFQSLSNELATPKILFCFADTRREAADWTVLQNSNISYFVGVDVAETNREMILAGERHLETAVPRNLDGTLSLNENDAVQWKADLHDGGGNVALVDGSIRFMTNAELRAQLTRSSPMTNRFMLPD